MHTFNAKDTMWPITLKNLQPNHHLHGACL